MSDAEPTGEDKSMEIAGKRTAADWELLRCNLKKWPSIGMWAFAYEDFFMERLRTRYLWPIELLQNQGGGRGEGFAIVSLQCAMIEFLQTVRDGANFCANGKKRYPPAELDGKYGNGCSRTIFEEFLTEQEPFKTEFKCLAYSFYANVRCSLLHEARTTGNWRITANSQRKKIVEKEGAILWLQRDRFQEALMGYLWRYKIDLLACGELQQAFIRKFDALAG